MLSLQFPHRLQLRTLAAAGLDTAQLRQSGFRWASNQWLAHETPEARATHARIQRVLDAQAHEADSATGGERRAEVTCRTQTVCDDCGRNIGPGEAMLQIQAFSGGTIHVERRCTCCYDASMVAA